MIALAVNTFAVGTIPVLHASFWTQHTVLGAVPKLCVTRTHVALND
jgi:hypothetical protein